MVANAVDIDLKQYDEILGALYDAPLHSDKWAIALQHFRDLFEANYVTLILRILDNDGSGDRKSTRLNSSHSRASRMPSSA